MLWWLHRHSPTASRCPLWEVRCLILRVRVARWRGWRPPVLIWVCPRLCPILYVRALVCWVLGTSPLWELPLLLHVCLLSLLGLLLSYFKTNFLYTYPFSVIYV